MRTCRKTKLQYSSSCHRRMVTLSKGETYRAFVLGVRYNRTNYLDHKALFEFGLYLPRGNPCGTFTINTSGMKRLLAGEYNKVLGNKAKWKEVQNILTIAKLKCMPRLPTQSVKTPPSRFTPLPEDAVQVQESSDSEAETQPLAQRSRKPTWPAMQAKTKPSKRFQSLQYGSNDSLVVRDIASLSNPRSVYNKRAGYADIDVLLIGKPLVPIHDESRAKFALPKLKRVRHDSVWDKAALPVDLGAGEWEKEKEKDKKADGKLPPLHLKKQVHWQSMDRQLSIVMTGCLVSDSFQRRVG